VSGFDDGREPDPDARVIWATCGGVRVASVYVPNGRELDHDHYRYKLDWLGRLRNHLDRHHSPDELLVVLGDWNIAPDDRDVWKPEAFAGMTHVSDPERAALSDVKAWGLVDTFRERFADDGLFSYWDYRAGDFHQRRGMRIDYLLSSRALAALNRNDLVDRNARRGPSRRTTLPCSAGSTWRHLPDASPAWGGGVSLTVAMTDVRDPRHGSDGFPGALPEQPGRSPVDGLHGVPPTPRRLALRRLAATGATSSTMSSTSADEDELAQAAALLENVTRPFGACLVAPTTKGIAEMANAGELLASRRDPDRSWRPRGMGVVRLQPFIGRSRTRCRRRWSWPTTAPRWCATRFGSAYEGRPGASTADTSKRVRRGARQRSRCWAPRG
jgi:hypothetical protein